MTAFTIDVYSYVDKRLDIDVTSKYLTNTIISLTILPYIIYTSLIIFGNSQRELAKRDMTRHFL